MHKFITIFLFIFFFFFNDTATTEIYTLSLHDALPISCTPPSGWCIITRLWGSAERLPSAPATSSTAAIEDRKSTRLNSSHANISYAVFCLKKKNKRSKIHDM